MQAGSALFGAPRPLRLLRDVFIVDPDPRALSRLRSAVEAMTASVVTCSTFKQARTALRTYAPSLLVTNLRLDEFNGLHLVLLTAGLGTRGVVYGSASADRGLASDIRRFGAFHETEAHLCRALPAYLHASLPEIDRRDSPGSDRRALPRGGRRTADTRVEAHLQAPGSIVSLARPQFCLPQAP